MKTVTVGKNDAGQRVDKFLQKTFRSLPTTVMYKEIRKKNIKLNGKRCEIATRLSEGDVLALYVKDEFLEESAPQYDFLTAGKRLSIVYEDDNLLLLNKEAGLLVHPDEQEYRDTLITRVQRYLYEKGEYRPEEENSFAPALVNRIDRNTCGIVMAAVLLIPYYVSGRAPRLLWRGCAVATAAGALNKIANFILVFALLFLDASVQYPMVTGGVMIVSTALCLLRKTVPSKRELCSVGLAFLGMVALFAIPI